MMYTIYNEATGQILFTINSEAVDMINESYIEGNYNDQEYYIENGVAMNKPPRPDENYNWNVNSKVWELDINLTRIKRNRLLLDIDRVNPIWYASLTAEQQNELQQRFKQ